MNNILNLNYKYETKINSTYIIRMQNNMISQLLAKRCYDSCISVNQPNVYYFDAIDGSDNKNIIVPDSSFSPILKLIKHPNTMMTISEVACFLSHILLWSKCVELDEPIVILEHDAIMVNSYTVHPFLTAISYLGCIEQANTINGNGQFPLSFPMPPHGQLTPNFRFMLRAHAYSIDPMIARQLVAKVIKYGIFTSADVFIRADEFSIIQEGFYAYDLPGKTTIPDRVEEEDIEDKKTRFAMLTN